MRVFTKFSLRFAVYLLVVAYLVADLYLLEGPLKKRLKASDPSSPAAIAAAKANGVVARVFYNQITRKQLDHAIYQRLWLRGRALEDLTPSEKNLTTYAALGQLIDYELLRVKVAHNTLDLPVSEAEIYDRLKRFASRFQSKDDLRSSMKKQGLQDEKNLRNFLAASIQQEKYVALRTDPLVEVSNQEIEDYYENHQAALTTPKRIRARHIFIATLDTPSDEAKAILQRELTRITNGQSTFEASASRTSEDLSTNEIGGDLGWMSASRLPTDFSNQVFLLPLNRPTLIRTKLGWHIIEKTKEAPSETPSLEALRPKIAAAIRTQKRHQAVSDFRSALRKFEAHKIEIFHDQLK